MFGLLKKLFSQKKGGDPLVDTQNPNPTTSGTPANTNTNPVDLNTYQQPGTAPVEPTSTPPAYDSATPPAVPNTDQPPAVPTENVEETITPPSTDTEEGTTPPVSPAV